MAKWSRSEKSWERQPKESAQAYEALSLYLSMGAERSLRKVAQELGKSNTLISRWSSAWNWQKRSRDYDNEIARQKLEEQRKDTEKMQKRHIQTAMLLQKKAVEALDKLSFEELSARDIIRFISFGAELERETRKESIGAAEGTSGDGSQISSLADTISAAYKRRMEEGEG